jgi:hypothetical protein
VNGRVVSSGVVSGDLGSPRTTSIDNTRPFTTFYRLPPIEHLSEDTTNAP